MQQWGYLSFSAVVTVQKVITYPIALSEIALPVAIAIAESYGNDAGLAINNDCMGNHYSSCEFNVISYGTQRCVGIIFVVIGKQQWGEYDVSAIGADTSTTTIVPLLISMANTNYVVCISKHKIGTAWSHTSPTLTKKELEKFTVVTWNNYSGSAQPTTQMYLLVGQ